MTVGVRHVTFWEFAEGERGPKRGRAFGICNMPDEMCTAAYLPMGGSSLALTGGSDGGYFYGESKGRVHFGLV